MINKYSYIDDIYCKELNENIKGFFSAKNMEALRYHAKKGIVFQGTEYRPDKLAFYYLGDERLGWLISLANNFSNGIKDYYLGRKLIIPTEEGIFKLKKGE